MSPVTMTILILNNTKTCDIKCQSCLYLYTKVFDAFIKINKMNSSDSDFACTPPDIQEAANAASLHLLPPKSKNLYEKAYNEFIKWRQENHINSFSERVVLAYFSKLSSTMKPSTVWSKYSMQNSKGYKPTKSKSFTREQIDTFIQEAPDNIYLLTKTILVFGIAGACRSGELSKLTINDLEDLGKSVIVKITETKNNVDRKFIINGDYLECYKRYIVLRPQNTKDNRLFYAYRNGKCINQVLGKNMFYKVPQDVAGYLKLSNPECYTGHAFRRSSATMLVESGGDLLTLKKHGGWKSSTIAEQYVDDSTFQRNKIAQKVLGTSNEMENEGSNEPFEDTVIAPSSSNGNAQPNIINQTKIENIKCPNELKYFGNCSFSNCNFSFNVTQ